MSQAHMPSSDTSYNFEVGKVAAILVVVLGHFLPGRHLWIIVTVGLFVFGFSSGYFTSARYHDRFDVVKFWRKKIQRLGPSLLLINTFLLLLFVVQQREGIWTWQTVLGMLGVKGFLTWFGLPNPSPFGAGLWFFTLLLIFYALYPALRSAGRSRRAMVVVVVVAFVAAAVLNRFVTMGHMLWLTAWSFVLGVAVQRLGLSLPARLSGLLAAVLGVLAVVLNVKFGFKHLNFFFAAAMSASVVLWLKDVPLPRKLFSPLQLFSGCVLEIYFLHSYLFIEGTGNVGLDMLASFGCILAVSWLLSQAADKLRDVMTRTPIVCPT